VYRLYDDKYYECHFHLSAAKISHFMLCFRQNCCRRKAKYWEMLMNGYCECKNMVASREEQLRRDPGKPLSSKTVLQVKVRS
jgi:hypothetical protein